MESRDRLNPKKLIDFNENNIATPNVYAEKFFTSIDKKKRLITINVCGLTRCGKSTLLNYLISQFKNEKNVKERFKIGYNETDDHITNGFIFLFFLISLK